MATDRRTHPRIELQRIYDALGHEGGYRVLVDRLWPRGVKKDDAALDEWAKDVAPSDELRRWYGHEPERFTEFERRYRDELRHSPASDVVQHLRDVARDRPVVLLTATRDVDHSGGKVLFDHLSRRVSRARPGRAPRG
ncbi:MAG TPA: DUF488 family protein [Acidimicrobiia bacterium]|jgi:uncharacterized protein YeaO (DUF488 family)